MKKTVLAFTAFTLLQAGTVLASPINDLSRSQTAVGLSTDAFYLEHQISNNVTVGFQNTDWDRVSYDDIYGQFKLDNNLKGIIGSRDWASESKFYMGLAATAPLSPDWKGHASVIAGSEFKEFQAGASYALAGNVDLNVMYHTFRPDDGKAKSGADFGVTFKF